MKNSQTWGMVLIVAGILGIIVLPISGYFAAALVVLGIFGIGYLILKKYVLPDDDKEKEK